MSTRRPLTPQGMASALILASLGLLTGPSAQAGAPGKGPDTPACSQVRAGQAHVIRTFCDGPGILIIRVGDRERVLRGGRCETLGAMMSFNVGAVTDLSATLNPDYVGLTVERGGPFSNAVLAVRLDGQRYRVPQNHGVAGPRGGSFEGLGQTATPKGPAVSVKGSYSC